MNKYRVTITLDNDCQDTFIVDAKTVGEAVNKAKDKAEIDHPGRLVWSTKLETVNQPLPHFQK